MSLSRSQNFLEVSLAEFKTATKIFSRRGVKLGKALLAYEGGFLSIESGDCTAVMHATGNWHGRATFSPSILQALVSVPPALDPIPIAYADNHLLVGGMTIACGWETATSALILNLENPDLLGLLALERAMPRAEYKGSELGKRVRSAKSMMERRIKKAAEQLADLGVKEGDIRKLVDTRIKERMIGERDGAEAMKSQ